ncbi:MAG: DUF357 domain-containing protein [Candidatus Hermodarchaeota archaeon]
MSDENLSLIQKMRESIEKEIQRMKAAHKQVTTQNPQGEDLLLMSRSYLIDAEDFYQKKQIMIAFEAIMISWTYFDSALRLKLITIPKELRSGFTID